MVKTVKMDKVDNLENLEMEENIKYLEKLFIKLCIFLIKEKNRLLILIKMNIYKKCWLIMIKFNVYFLKSISCLNFYKTEMINKTMKFLN